jgi:ribosomal-protein-alanine N-acetyltransferase
MISLDTPPAEVILDRMEESDLEEILQMETSVDLSPWSRPSFLEEMKLPFSHCYVLRKGEPPAVQTIGYLCFRTVGDESDLLKMGIHPKERRKGYGRQLMRFYTGFCQSEGIRTFHLETGSSNEAAIGLYRSFSYYPVGVRPRFYRGREDALLMTKKASPFQEGKEGFKPHP